MTVWLSPPALRVQVTPIPPGVIYGTTVVAGSPDAPVRRRVQLFAWECGLPENLVARAAVACASSCSPW